MPTVESTQQVGAKVDSWEEVDCVMTSQGSSPLVHSKERVFCTVEIVPAVINSHSIRCGATLGSGPPFMSHSGAQTISLSEDDMSESLSCEALLPFVASAELQMAGTGPE